jgi:hypothetical protein
MKRSSDWISQFIDWAILPAETDDFYLIELVLYRLLADKGNKIQAQINHYLKQNPAYGLRHKI